MNSVLIVEDNFQLATHWQRLLELDDIRVVHEVDAEAAIECLKSDKSIDLVITDMVLASSANSAGEQGGLLVLAFVSLNLYPPPKVIAVSGAATSPTFINTFNILSPVNVLNKPVDDFAFVRRVKDILAERKSETDLRERAKAVESALRMNQFAVEHSSEAVFWIQPDGSFSDVNQTASDYLGYTKAELCGMTVSDINPSYPIELWPKHWQETKELGVLKFETEHYRKDGTTYDCAITKHFLDFEGQEVIYATVRDISAQKIAKAELIESKRIAEESESRFRLLADSASPLCWVTELDSTCSWLNKRWLDFCGRPLEEQTGYGWIETVHPDDRKRVKGTYLEAFEQQAPFDMAYRLRRHDGVYRWHTVNATTRHDETGKFVGYVGMSFDDQDAKENRESLEASQFALQEATETLQATLNLLGTSDGVWDWRVGSQQATYAPGFRKLLGYDGDDLEGFPNTLDAFESRFHAEDKDGFWQALEESFKNKSALVYELRVLNKSDQYIWVRSRANASFNEDGNAIRLVGSVYDISEKKNIEMERDRFFNTAEDLHAVVDLGSLKWVKLNPTWEATFGHKIESILKTPVPDMHPVEEHAQIRVQVERLLNGESVRRWVCRMFHRDGSVRFIEWNINPPLPGETIVYGTGRDVTLLRRLMRVEANSLELTSSNKKLSRSNLDLAQFAYVASHDLQEPLRAVGGFLQLLKAKKYDQLDEQARDYIDKSVDGAARMNQLINDLLHYSRVSGDSSDFGVVDLNRCVELACSKLGKAISESGASIETSQLPSIVGIETLLVQLFQNLIGNAIKYRSERVPMIKIHTEEGGEDLVRIHIQDNGIGIPLEYQDQVFALFKRLHHREEYVGTGIGLAICQRVVERHGGSISVKSEEGDGACFTVLLARNFESNSD